MIIMFFTTGCSFRIPSRPHHVSVSFHEKGADNEGGVAVVYPTEEEVYPMGSSLPDCSHACGPCFPCKRVMVSFKCSTAESCPIVYRCMCKGKYYHVPSN
ncbi:protein EPIDERMAL PATTERNING FACTOR 2-like [Melia azedarach]|uniref:Protein EPIDERMAL PATTERNING FACTOR 2-like n=1 Tax=Melia azedarach TaxID=155640 RepID=A0ACC1WPS6_MELAZ|nr:protein EPIDERMAL PATTERNING FACTOR 2-like [Melia azedarach]